MDKIENEVKAQNFMRYIADNEKELKKNLLKNITYDKDIFEDVFNETILKIYNSIVKNGTDIKDYKQYFFMCSKFTYILWDNRNKKHKNRMVYDYFINNDLIDERENVDGKVNNMVEVINTLRTELNNVFQQNEVELFFNYFTEKVSNGTSYKKIAQQYEMTTKQLIEIINRIKDYIKSNDKLNNLRNVLFDNADN